MEHIGIGNRRTIETYSRIGRCSGNGAEHYSRVRAALPPLDVTFLVQFHVFFREGKQFKREQFYSENRLKKKGQSLSGPDLIGHMEMYSPSLFFPLSQSKHTVLSFHEGGD